MKRSFMAGLDMYRKVPADLLEGTKRGSAMSIIAVFGMFLLVFMETRAFLKTYVVTDLFLDHTNPNVDNFNRYATEKIRVNFNITMMDLKCEWAVVDVVSPLGTEQNITQHISKFSLDQSGVKKRFYMRNQNQQDLVMFDETVTETIEELTADGVDAIDLDPERFELAKAQNKFLFVDFYASWCSHCRMLAPTWETLAEVMDAAAAHIVDKDMKERGIEVGEEEHHWTEEDYDHAVRLSLPVVIAKVDCVIHEDFCMQQNIRAYPTLRLFVQGAFTGDYNGHRTVVDFTDYLATMEKNYLQEHGQVDFADEIARKHHASRGGTLLEDDDPKNRQRLKRIMRKEWLEQDHPGCQLSGFLMLNRVPGNFHIQARSTTHDLVPHMTNVSHEVHSLTFGEPYVRRRLEKGLVANVPQDLNSRLNPMDGNVYITENLHEAHHHYLKIVSTYYPDLDRTQQVYQILQSSQLIFLPPEEVPEAKFQYDLSPIAVSYKTKTRQWYDYITSLMAIIGGTFTVVGMLESSIHAVTRKKRF